MTSNSPQAGSEVVLEHRVAGDLIMPAATVQAAGLPPSPARDALRRRPKPRALTLAPAPPTVCNGAQLTLPSIR